MPSKFIVFDCDGTLIQVEPTSLKLCPGIVEILDWLTSQAIDLSVWTGRDRSSTLQYLKQLQIAHYFRAFECSDTCMTKPHVDGLQKLLEGQEKANCLLIGDSATDLQGAKNYGISCIFVDWNERLDSVAHQEVLDYGAKAIVSKSTDLKMEIKNFLAI